MALSLSACTSAPDASPSPSGASAKELNLVVIGDSIPYNSPDDCPGCTGFVTQYAKVLESKAGRTVVIANRSRHDGAKLADIAKQLGDDASLRSELANADAVIVSIGFNNGAPWPSDRPCKGTPGTETREQIATVLAYTPSCITATIKSYEAEYNAIYSSVTKQVGGKSNVRFALTVHNTWIGFPGIETQASPVNLAALIPITRRIADQWNAMLCRVAIRNGFACVDVYHAFNGPQGNLAAGANLVADYAHPSQQGNDVIAALLARVDVSALSP